MMGNMTVEEIYRERKTFSNAVFDVSKKDFVKFGMSIISYTLKDITDEVGYLKVWTVTNMKTMCHDYDTHQKYNYTPKFTYILSLRH